MRACPPQHPAIGSRLTGTDRKTLLLGTALASTLVLGTLLSPPPAKAVVACPPAVFAPPGPIAIINPADDIACINVFDRLNNAGNVITLATNGANEFIDLDNSGDLTASNAAAALGVFAYTYGANNSPIDIVNSGDVTVNAGIVAFGVRARAYVPNSSIRILNSGDVRATGNTYSGFGIHAYTYYSNSPIAIFNTGDVLAVSNGINSVATGIYAVTGYYLSNYDNSPITIVNHGEIRVAAPGAGSDATGIYAHTDHSDSPINIVNSGAITVTGEDDAYGIFARASFGANSPVSIVNSGDITVFRGFGIRALTGTALNPDSPLSIVNSGNISSPRGGGIIGTTFSPYSPLSIQNSGNLRVATDGIDGDTFRANNPVNIVNSGDITASNNGFFAAIGIQSYTADDNSPITIVNSGKITASGVYNFFGVYASYGIDTESQGANSSIFITNTGVIDPEIGIHAVTYGPGSSIAINNQGSVYGDVTGILTLSTYGTTTIFNSGDISAGSQRAIDVDGGAATIFNRGLITGFVDLTERNDRFFNQSGGVFEARLASLFGGGKDVFVNRSDGTVHTAGNALATETTRFIGLERFDNRGLISLVDNGPGDAFIVSNTVGGTDLNFVGSGNSTVALDTFLDGPASPTDAFIIQGDVFGQTTVQIDNTNPGPGTFNPQGIPVIFADGATPNPDAFFLPQPIDTGFFDYDLFFVPTNSGFWELRSFPGGGAYLLPQLITAAQDIWHQGSSTWFDRTADLRVLLNGGLAPAAYDPGGKDLGAAAPYSLTPAVWARASGSWLDRDDSETTRAFGRTYRFDLDRDLDTLDFQMGLDLGKRDVWSQGDALVFGLLGGFIHADLDYDTLIRSFDFDGGQVGAYATYLSGGLFVDTLLNAHIYELDANGTLGFPSSLDASTIGLRTDTGYRFGSFTGGPFWEPLATLEVTWADIDGFSLGGNTVSFDDDANVRGRLGIRAGTTTEVWEGTLMEPFVIGSLWGNFIDGNQATLVSTGRTFRFQDDLDDVWGEVSAGVNFFNVSQTTAVFAKADVTFGDDVTGVGGKAGMRVNW